MPLAPVLPRNSSPWFQCGAHDGFFRRSYCIYNACRRGGSHESHRHHRFPGGCAVMSMMLAQRLPVGPVPADCNRACLEGLINQYLDAVVAHDPKPLPLSADVKYTEQEQIMEVGDGFWKTVTGRGNYNHYFADPVAGQAGWMGTMREKAGVLLMTVRLRVQLGRITEIETSYFRAGGGGPNNIEPWTKWDSLRLSGCSRFHSRSGRRDSSLYAINPSETQCKEKTIGKTRRQDCDHHRRNRRHRRSQSSGRRLAWDRNQVAQRRPHSTAGGHQSRSTDRRMPSRTHHPRPAA